jgi:hypothetical protein
MTIVTQSLEGEETKAFGTFSVNFFKLSLKKVPSLRPGLRIGSVEAGVFIPNDENHPSTPVT